MTGTQTPTIEVFRSGTFTSMEGRRITYTPAQLRAIADAYDPATAPAPAVVGHPDHTAPALAWVRSFAYDAQADRLRATLEDVQPELAEAVAAKTYRRVSLSMFDPDHPANPRPGTWYPRHVGFLGGAAPAVTGLRLVEFALPSSEATTIEGDLASFGDGSAAATASIVRRLRDWMIEQFGLDTADRVLPGYEIQWLSDIGSQPATPGFASPPLPDPVPDPTPTEDNPVTTTPTPAPAPSPDAADLARREAALAQAQAALAAERAVSFAERLVADGRLIPASRDQVAALLTALSGPEAGTATVSFAAGAPAIAPADALRRILEAQPRVVSYGAYAMPADTETGAVASFAAGDGRPVDRDRMELHHQALAFQRQHPGTSYADAVRAVS
ncbi:hypothetical protein P7L78_09170 [Tistrella bauzanensis]|uniref:hypothetical protein n=1 Tax=Tistrella TaxID=171436 RepID=UPI0031F69FD7